MGDVPIDRRRAEKAIADFLDALGLRAHEHPELVGTPERVTIAYVEEFLAGYRVNVGDRIRDARTQTETKSWVILRGIHVATTCPHHLMPALGRADVAYLPAQHAIGLGAVVDVVHAFARRLTLQETLGEQIADALVRELPARSASVRMEMRHTCLSTRDARAAETTVVSIASAGDPSLAHPPW